MTRPNPSAAPSRKQALRPVSRAARSGLLLPYGLVESMEPGGKLWEALATAGPVRPVVYGLVAPWGAVPEHVLASNPEIVGTETELEASASRAHASARLRAWLDTFAPRHTGLAAVVLEPFAPVWDRAIQGWPLASRTKVISITSRSRNQPWLRARRQLSEHLLRLHTGQKRIRRKKR